jgi:hypothetical protein
MKETQDPILAAPKFRKFLPWEPLPQSRQREFWVNTFGVRQITAGNLNYNSKEDAFQFELSSPNALPPEKSSAPVRLLFDRKA